MLKRSLALLSISALLISCRTVSDGTHPPSIESTDGPPVATFSIVGYDPDTEEWGVAVQSKFLAVGAVVPWAKAGVGAVATQSFANTTYGPRGLEMFAEGLTAEEVIKALTEGDQGRSRRQVGVIDSDGNPATFTGSGCMSWAGGVVGEHYCAQGNILAGEEVVKEMGRAFEEGKDKDLGERLIDALAAGQKAGGDKRGRQSASLLVVKDKGGYAGYNDRYRDLRVDDHPEPIKELRRIYDLHRKTFSARRGR